MRPKIEQASEYLTVPEFAGGLRIAEKTAWNWLGQRRIDSVRVGRCVRIPASEARRILEEGFVPRVAAK